MRRAAWALLAAAPLLGACGSASEPAPSGLDEPVRVRFTPPRTQTPVPGQFFPGPLPTGTLGPAAAIMNNQVLVFPGQQGKRLSGVTGAGATGVGIKFTDFGSGYWVVPVLIPDTNMPGSLIWELLLDFGRDVPFGSHSIQVAAVDADKRWGEPSQTSLFFQTLEPTGIVVASLTWDSNADLDLQVITPTGVIDAKHVSGGMRVDGGVAPGAGVLDHDSNASCIPDGRRRESVIWNDVPTPGLYLAKVDMFSACGEPATNFVFELYVQNQLQVSLPGRLIAMDADNGAGPGLAITNFQF